MENNTEKKVPTKRRTTPSKEEKFDFNDILIEPATQSKIISRKEINIRHGAPQGLYGHLPLIAAPMDTVVSKENVGSFLGNGINVCMPRGEYIDSSSIPYRGAKMIFISYSLIEFTEKFIAKKGVKHPSHILIDIANGHMSDLVYVTKKAKEHYGKTMQLMVGNVANPKTYKLLSEAGADYIRVGIGNGGGCLTTQQTGIGYPMASLVSECYKVGQSIKKENRAKIVADGGMKDYSDIIKALALGADYVMVGSIFNMALESCGTNRSNYWFWNGMGISQEKAEKRFRAGKRIFKEFRGMSTKEVQKKWGKETLKTSEGVVRWRPVLYTLSQWKENFEHYLKSAMSYTDSIELDKYIGKVKYNKISYQSFKRYNK